LTAVLTVFAGGAVHLGIVLPYRLFGGILESEPGTSFDHLKSRFRRRHSLQNLFYFLVRDRSHADVVLAGRRARSPPSRCCCRSPTTSRGPALIMLAGIYYRRPVWRLDTAILSPAGLTSRSSPASTATYGPPGAGRPALAIAATVVLRRHRRHLPGARAGPPLAKSAPVARPNSSR